MRALDMKNEEGNMSTSHSENLEALKIITDFLSDNMIVFLIMLLVIVNRRAISNLITRFTSINYKKGDSQIGIEAAAPTKEDSHKDKELSNAIEKPLTKEDSRASAEAKEESKENDWSVTAHKALDENRLEDAEKAFDQYASNEQDELKVEENKAFYLFLLFEKGKDNSAIQKLEELATTAKSEKTKHNTLVWLSFCYQDSSQVNKQISLWQEAVNSFTESELITRSIVSLAHALKSNDQSEDAKEILLSRLKVVNNDLQKSSIFSSLSEIEESLGNKKIAIYCKDKSMEYDASNRDELFDLAYSASKQGIDTISISNYLTLLRIDSDNSIALNNLGVEAQSAGLKIKAVEKYIAASNKNNTLAMANQGSLLLEAGFIEEAEKIAKEASKKDDPHENVYSLLSNISKKRKEQNKEWDELSKKTLDKQKHIRLYTEQYYLGSYKNIVGDWVLDNGTILTIEKDNTNITWIDSSQSLAIGNTDYIITITGRISGSTITGRYKRKRNTKQISLLDMGSDKDIPCIGFISNDGMSLNIVSDSHDNDLHILSRKPNA
jgi:Na+-transporting methylmalonyl-CoA/oxaloacetate decarboxylase gamma subunit